jgi:hypothetical protein
MLFINSAYRSIAGRVTVEDSYSDWVAAIVPYVNCTLYTRRKSVSAPVCCTYFDNDSALNIGGASEQKRAQLSMALARQIIQKTIGCDPPILIDKEEDRCQ